ncbi:hypothetical protein [Pedobacter sp. SYSU D00535]|uniref:hypothetical protein n=1 Tax=Pedobacter sp. SYSU D00535 TaxID=2810308 RepID=UPI001A9722D2|nr:hypothetical protein [Pedobacter sp. SYSU D00535]
MDSFKIKTKLGTEWVEILVVPDDCSRESIYHLILHDDEVVKMVYSDERNWEFMEGTHLSPEELKAITQEIERHFKEL